MACPTTASIEERSNPSGLLTSRRKNRKRQKRKGRKKRDERKKQRNRHRMPSGFPEQESGDSLILVSTEITLHIQLTHVNAIEADN